MPGEAINAGKVQLANWLPELLNNAMALARGIECERISGDDRVVYKVPPFFPAIVYLIDRAMGKVATETNATEERLNVARAMFLELQIANGWIDAQVKDMNARGERALTENEMWKHQFVTEDQQEEQLRRVADAFSKHLQHMTPEALHAIMPELKDPADSLMKLRGEIGRSAADMIQEVLTGGKEVADEEEEPE